MINDLGENAVPERLKPYYLSVLADTYLGLSAYPRALKLYREALALDPEFFRTDPDLYARMAEAAYRLNDFAGAKDYMLSAVNLSRKDNKAEYLVTLGDCLYKMGRKGQAMSVFSEVENIAPRAKAGSSQSSRPPGSSWTKILPTTGSSQTRVLRDHRHL